MDRTWGVIAKVMTSAWTQTHVHAYACMHTYTQGKDEGEGEERRRRRRKKKKGMDGVELITHSHTLTSTLGL